MSIFLALMTSLWTRLATGAASVAVLAFLGPLAPVISGIGQFIGAIITAIGEILASLSKSAEGRVALCLVAAVLGFLYLRFHYIEEGREQGKAIASAKYAATQKPCPSQRMTKMERRTR